MKNRVETESGFEEYRDEKSMNFMQGKTLEPRPIEQLESLYTK